MGPRHASQRYLAVGVQAPVLHWRLACNTIGNSVSENRPSDLQDPVFRPIRTAFLRPGVTLLHRSVTIVADLAPKGGPHSGSRCASSSPTSRCRAHGGPSPAGASESDLRVYVFRRRGTFGVRVICHVSTCVRKGSSQVKAEIDHHEASGPVTPASRKDRLLGHRGRRRPCSRLGLD